MRAARLFAVSMLPTTSYVKVAVSPGTINPPDASFGYSGKRYWHGKKLPWAPHVSAGYATDGITRETMRFAASYVMCVGRFRPVDVVTTLPAWS